jgi:hypothetical protein
MANEGVTGRVVDENGVGIANLVVGAFDIGLFGERLLPNTANASDPIFPQFGRTESDGRFSSSYSGGRHDLFVRVYDTVKRKLGISSIHHDVAIGMSSSSASSASRAPPTLPRPRSLDRCNSSWGLD